MPPLVQRIAAWDDIGRLNTAIRSVRRLAWVGEVPV
jgi:hypothetical protein